MRRLRALRRCMLPQGWCGAASAHEWTHGIHDHRRRRPLHAAVAAAYAAPPIIVLVAVRNAPNGHRAGGGHVRRGEQHAHRELLRRVLQQLGMRRLRALRRCMLPQGWCGAASAHEWTHGIHDHRRRRPLHAAVAAAASPPSSGCMLFRLRHASDEHRAHRGFVSRCQQHAGGQLLRRVRQQPSLRRVRALWRCMLSQRWSCLSDLTERPHDIPSHAASCAAAVALAATALSTTVFMLFRLRRASDEHRAHRGFVSRCQQHAGGQLLRRVRQQPSLRRVRALWRCMLSQRWSCLSDLTERPHDIPSHAASCAAAAALSAASTAPAAPALALTTASAGTTASIRLQLGLWRASDGH